MPDKRGMILATATTLIQTMKKQPWSYQFKAIIPSVIFVNAATFLVRRLPAARLRVLCLLLFDGSNEWYGDNDLLMLALLL